MRKNKKILELHLPGGNFYSGKYLGSKGTDYNFSSYVANKKVPVDYYMLEDDEDEEGLLESLSELNLSFLLEDADDEDEEPIDEMSAGGVAGVGMKLGYNPDGTPTSRRQLKKLRSKQNIYTRDLREAQNWSNKTSGKIRY